MASAPPTQTIISLRAGVTQRSVTATPDTLADVTRFLRNLMYSAFTAAFALSLFEVALRVSGWPDPGIYAGDPASLWTLRVSMPARQVPFRERNTTFSVRTNSFGYRGGEPSPGAILCLGDSTTFGWGVEEDEAWPMVLGHLLGERTVNGGVPGYSTVQALATIDHALTLKPRLVLLAYLVRDAELAQVADADRRPGPARPDFAIARAIRALRGGQTNRPGTVRRVSPTAYLANIRTLVARIRAAGANVRVLAFPMQTEPTPYLDALRALDGDVPVLTPILPAAAYFPEDPIHLTAKGNADLANLLAGKLRGSQ